MDPLSQVSYWKIVHCTLESHPRRHSLVVTIVCIFRIVCRGSMASCWQFPQGFFFDLGMFGLEHQLHDFINLEGAHLLWHLVKWWVQELGSWDAGMITLWCFLLATTNRVNQSLQCFGKRLWCRRSTSTGCGLTGVPTCPSTMQRAGTCTMQRTFGIVPGWNHTWLWSWRMLLLR